MAHPWPGKGNIKASLGFITGPLSRIPVAMLEPEMACKTQPGTGEKIHDDPEQIIVGVSSNTSRGLLWFLCPHMII